MKKKDERLILAATKAIITKVTGDAEVDIVMKHTTVTGPRKGSKVQENIERDEALDWLASLKAPKKYSIVIREEIPTRTQGVITKYPPVGTMYLLPKGSQDGEFKIEMKGEPVQIFYVRAEKE